jgi:hypothetical protein
MAPAYLSSDRRKNERRPTMSSKIVKRSGNDNRISRYLFLPPDDLFDLVGGKPDLAPNALPTHPPERYHSGVADLRTLSETTPQWRAEIHSLRANFET